jgi:hypothetical protein
MGVVNNMHDSSANSQATVAICRAIEFHSNWLEQKLGVPLSELVVVEVDLDLTQIGVERNLGYHDSDATPTRTMRRLKTLVAATEAPGDFPPVLQMTYRVATEDLDAILGGTKPKNNPGFRWGDCPIALRFHLNELVLIAINVSYHDGPAASYESTARLIIARRDCAAGRTRDASGR